MNNLLVKLLHLLKWRQNFGFLEAPNKLTDYRFGLLTGISAPILMEDGQWDNYLPEYEPQYFSQFDTLACVSFSALNCIETLMMKRFNIVSNFSDRFLAKMSGTTNKGNFLYKVADSIRIDGLISEDSWSVVTSSREDYYSDIPVNIQSNAKDILNYYDFQYEFVTPDINLIMDALRYTPLQAAINTYGGVKNGIIQRSEAPANHAMMLYGYNKGNYWKFYDQYSNKFKQYAWDTLFWGIIKYNIEEKKSMAVKLNENYLYQLVESPGGFSLYVGGKLLVDDLAKILASWTVRNNGDTKGKVGVLKLAEYNLLPKYNLKMEQIL